MLTDGYFVYNLAHHEQCIRSKHGSIRILGAFSTREEAEAFVQEWTLEQPDLETRVSPMNQWRMLSKSMIQLDEQKKLFETRWSSYLEEREKEFKDVEFRAANKIAGPIREVPNIKVSHSETPVVPSETVHEDKQQVPRVPKKLEVISQKFVGLSILQDSETSFHDQEPFFKVQCIGDNEADIENFLKTQSQDQVDHLGVQSSVPMAMVTLYEFVPLAQVATVRTRRFSPNKSLEEIRSGFTFENKDGGLDDSRVAGLAQSSDRTESDASVSKEN